MLFKCLSLLLLFKPPEKAADTCPADSIFGWSTSNRGTTLDGDDWTFVFPEKEVPCDGAISHWLYWARRREPFRAIVWRHTGDQDNQFQIVGINNVPAGSINEKVNYTVPVTERFPVLKGDLLGFAFKRSSLAYQHQRAERSRVHWFKNRSPYSMASGEIYIISSYGERGYSLAAIISPTTSGKISFMDMILYTLATILV